MRAVFIVVPLMALLLGSVVYCVLVVIGAARYLRSGAPSLRNLPPVSVLRPLSGAEDNTEANLRSLFEQRYPRFEILLSVHEESDPAAEIARRVMAAYPGVPAQLIVAGVSPFCSTLPPQATAMSARAPRPRARG